MTDDFQNLELSGRCILASTQRFRRVLVIMLMLLFVAPSRGWAQGMMEPLVTVDAEESEQPVDAPSSMKFVDPLEFDDPAGWDYLKPVGWMLFANGIFWAVGRFILQADYSRISPSTMADNFREGWEWDADAFPTNQFGHPYQGGLYHAGARVSGFGFWGSMAYTALGSWQWEMFMETERPSYNDLITTTVGGAIVGEVLFRLAATFLDDSSEGNERVAREGGALAISPILGFSRLWNGNAMREGLPQNRPPVGLRLAVGLDSFKASEAKKALRNIGLDVRVVYGSLDDDGESFRPFDWFSLSGGLNYREPDFQAADLDITGLLARWRFPCGANNDCFVGPSMHYDYYRTPVFSVGTSAIGGSILGRFELGFWALNLYAELDLHAIALGGFDSPYAEVVERDYNLGSGAFTRATLLLTKPDWFQIRIFNSRYYVRTLHGAAGNEFAGMFRSEVEIPIYKGMGISGGTAIYDRTGIPKNYPKIQSTYIDQQLQFFWRSRFGELL